MDDARGVDGLDHAHAVPRRLAALLRERVDVGPRRPVGDARGEGVRGDDKEGGNDARGWKGGSEEGRLKKGSRAALLMAWFV